METPTFTITMTLDDKVYSLHIPVNEADKFLTIVSKLLNEHGLNTYVKQGVSFDINPN